MNDIQRISVGVTGGFSAVLVKFITQDQSWVSHWANLHDQRIYDIALGYAILTPILMFIGGVVAAFADETSKIKLFALAIAGPGMITTWAGGVNPSTQNPTPQSIGPAGWLSPFEIVTPAFANGREVRVAQLSTIQNGVGAFFGGGKGEPHYWVVAGSFRDSNAAQELADSINRQNPDMHAFVGKRMPDNVYYPVIVGDYTTLSDATRLQDAVSQLTGVSSPYLSTYADRRP